MAEKISKETALASIRLGTSYYSAFSLIPIVGKQAGTVIWTGGNFYLLSNEEFSLKVRDVEWGDDQPRITYEITIDQDRCKEVFESLQEEAKKLAIKYHGGVPVIYNRHWTHKH